jgi:hypothetical protein
VIVVLRTIVNRSVISWQEQNKVGFRLNDDYVRFESDQHAYLDLCSALNKNNSFLVDITGNLRALNGGCANNVWKVRVLYLSEC